MNTYPIYRERNSGREVDAIRHTQILKSSSAVQWNGLHLEVARSVGWHVDDLMVDGHLLAINLSDRDLYYRFRSEGDWLSVSLPPLGFWIHPEGRPFSIDHDQESYYASIFVDGRILDEVSGRHFELNAGCGAKKETG